MFEKLIKAADKIEKMFVLDRPDYDKITKTLRDKKVGQSSADRKLFEIV